MCFRRLPWWIETRVEKRVEEKKEVARYLLAHMQKPETKFDFIFFAFYSFCKTVKLVEIIFSAKVLTLLKSTL